MKFHKVFLAPNTEIAKQAETVGQELGLSGWIFDHGSLDYGVAKAKKYEKLGAKVLVSRSVSALTIAKAVAIPVVEIEMGAYDLLIALAKTIPIGKKVGVIGMPHVLYESKDIGEILGVEIHELAIQTFDEIIPAIEHARTIGVEALIGGHSSVEYANSIGMPGILLGASKRSIAGAMRRAEQLVAMRLEEEHRSANLNTILDFSYEGIVVTDSNDRIMLMNKTAQQMLGIKKNVVLGHPCAEILPFIDWRETKALGKECIGTLCRVGRQNLIHNITPVVVGEDTIGMVMTFQYAQNIETIERKIRKELYRSGHVAAHTFEHIVSSNPHMLKLIQRAKHMATVDSNILITGATGTGKEIFAQSIHNAGTRRNRPFVAINCASIPPNLLESELFGYESGAFTGASKTGKKGYFELATGGTLFLDEIGEIPVQLQAHLLRVLQEKEVMRVGGDKMIPVDVRIIAATHRDLQRALQEGEFRADLYHRLNVLRLTLPNLCERREDIPALVEMFLRQKTRALSLAPVALTEAALRRLVSFSWAGNIRELENVVERLLVMKRGETISVDDVDELTADLQPVAAAPRQAVVWEGTLEEMERNLIRQVYLETGQDRTATCRRLAISPTTLWRRLKEG